MRAVRRTRVLLALAFLATAATAGTAAADQDAVDRRAPLIGHVVDRNGHAVRGVCIDAYQVRETDHFATVSGKGGRFILDTTSWGRPETYYDIRLTPCDDRLEVAPEWYRHADDWFDKVPVMVRAGHTNHHDFVLRRQAVVQGSVTLLGRPVESACVIAMQWDQTNRDGADESQRITYADAQGRFTVTQLTPGSHPIAAYRSCGDPVALAHGTVVVREGERARVALEAATPR